MSYFIIGTLELAVETRSQQAYNYAKDIVRLALSFDYSIQFSHHFEDRFYRYILDPVRELYERDSSKTIEFQISDSPLTGSSDYIFNLFYKQISTDQTPIESQTTLLKFMRDLWENQYINRAVFIFSYGLNSFKTLVRKEVMFDEMLSYLTESYLEGIRDLNECFILQK